MLTKRIFPHLILLLVFSGCKDKFYADIKSPSTGYLIVEGNIIVGDQAVTTIKLSYTTPLDSPSIRPEPGAQVIIEDGLTNQYTLVATGNGSYQSAPLQLPADRSYRLHIITPNNREYYSGFTEAKISPEIDSISWVRKNEGIEIQLTTHDDQDKSRYYQWYFTETWEYQSAYSAALKYTDKIEYRNNTDPPIFRCWKTLSSPDIVVASTANLQKDYLYNKPITFVPGTNTDKLRIRYSIIVYQFVLSKECYEYMERMKKNTEQVGSIFDAQPSQLKGNIRCRNDSNEIVVGFIMASSITQKRIFIVRNELPSLNIPTFYETCLIDTTSLKPEELKSKFSDGNNLPIEYATAMSAIIGVIGSTSYCVDCRLRGGTNIKPPFWP